MTTLERQNVRRGLLAAGFERTNFGDLPKFYDSGNGVYTEVWTHTKDRTQITLDWDRKTKEK